MNLNNEILNQDLEDRLYWVMCRVTECDYKLEDLDVEYTDDPEDDHLVIFEALKVKMSNEGRGFKKLCFKYGGGSEPSTIEDF